MVNFVPVKHTPQSDGFAMQIIGDQKCVTQNELTALTAILQTLKLTLLSVERLSLHAQTASLSSRILIGNIRLSILTMIRQMESQLEIATQGKVSSGN